MRNRAIDPWPGTGVYRFRTSKAVIRLTMGRMTSSTGKATYQESAQADGHSASAFGPEPCVLRTLIADTTHVISSDRFSGMTREL